jgi:hypothetical protein
VRFYVAETFPADPLQDRFPLKTGRLKSHDLEAFSYIFYSGKASAL